jgi:hypothetical protein
MSAPFEKFLVRESWWHIDRFVIMVWPWLYDGGPWDAQAKERRREQVKFIEDAIREKLEREARQPQGETKP